MTDGRRLLATHAIRGVADGVVSVALAAYLTDLGFGPFVAPEAQRLIFQGRGAP